MFVNAVPCVLLLATLQEMFCLLLHCERALKSTVFNRVRLPVSPSETFPCRLWRMPVIFYSGLTLTRIKPVSFSVRVYQTDPNGRRSVFPENRFYGREAEFAPGATFYATHSVVFRFGEIGWR